MRLSITLASLLLILFWMSGCASTARDLGAAAAPVVVRASLHEVNDPDDQKQIQHLTDSQAFQHAGRSIGEGVGIGLFNQANKFANGDESAAADASPTTARTTKPTTAQAKSPGGAAMAGIAGGGGLNGFVKSSVQEAFLAATDPQFKKGEEAMSEAIGEGFVTGMITVINKKGPDLGQTIRTQLGPIFQELMREQIAPAVRDMIQQQLAPAALQVWQQGAVDTLKLTVRPDLQPDVQQNAQNASIGAEHGTHQVMIESGIITPTGDLSPRLKLYLWSAAIILGLILLAIVSLLVMLNMLVLHHWRSRHSRAA